MTKASFISALFCSSMAFSQVTIADNYLVKDGKTYSISEYKQVFSNAQAQQFMAKSRTNRTVAGILGFAGGFSLGASIPMMLRKKEQSIIRGPYGDTVITTGGPYGYGYALVGLGLIAAGIPFEIAGKRNREKAIATENGQSSANSKPYFKLENAGNGLAFSYNF